MLRASRLSTACAFALLEWATLGCASTVDAAGGAAGGGEGAGPSCNSCGAPSCELAHQASASQHGAGVIDVESVVADEDGGAFVVGYLNESIDLGTGVIDGGTSGGFIAAFAGDGSARWARGYESALPLAITRKASGTIVVVGSLNATVDLGGGPISGALFQLELDAAGQHVSSRGFEGDADVSEVVVAADTDGSIVLVGVVFYEGALDLGNGEPIESDFDSAPFVARFGPEGVLEWSHSFHTENSIGGGMAMDSSGNIVWAVVASASAEAFGTSMTHDGILLVSLDRAGETRWVRPLLTSYGLLPKDVAVGLDGAAVVTGVADGAVDFGAGPSEVNGTFLAKYDANGKHIFSNVFGDGELSSDNWGNSAAVDDCGDIYLAASAQAVDFGGGVIAGSFDDSEVALARFDESGVHLSSKSYGRVGTFDVGRLDLTSDGAIFFAGGADSLAGVIDFGGGEVHAGEDATLFRVRLAR